MDKWDCALQVMDPSNYIDAQENEFWISDPAVSAEDRVIKEQLFSRLSKEAKFVISIVLNSPTEILGINGKIGRGKLFSFLRERGWKVRKVNKAKEEVKSFLWDIGVSSYNKNESTTTHQTTAQGEEKMATAKIETTLVAVKKAIKELNGTGLLDETITLKNKKLGDLKTEFMAAIEKLATEKAADFKKKVSADLMKLNNALVDELEAANKSGDDDAKAKDTNDDAKAKAATASKPKKPKAEKPAKKDGVYRPRAGSRPGALFDLMIKGKSLDDCLADKNLMEKYAGKAAWVKADFAKLEPSVKEASKAA